MELVRGHIGTLARLPGGGFEVGLRGPEGTLRRTADTLVIAAGPFSAQLADLLGVHLPIRNYLQRKVIIPDPAGIVPGDMPFTVCADAMKLRWSTGERRLIEADPEYHWLLEEFPPGLHIKPEPGGRIKLGWAINRQAEAPHWEPAGDVDFPNLVIRGASRFIPAFQAYVDRLPTPVISMAGYYSRTPENWPLIGPLPVEGLFTVSALSGFGTMAACAAGELCGAWITGAPLPPYAPYFDPERYRDEAMCVAMQAAASDGQL